MNQDSNATPNNHSSEDESLDWHELVKTGYAAYDLKRYTEAELKFAAALRIAEKNAAPEILKDASPEEKNELLDKLAKSLNNMAALYHTQGKYSMAEDLYKRCLEIKQELYGEEHLEVAINLHNLAALYSAKRRFPQAEPFYKRALEIREKLLGPDHLDLVLLLNNYALMLKRDKREDEAKQMEERAAKIQAAHQVASAAP